MQSGAEAGRDGWRKTSFIRRRCGRETRWRERKRKAGGSRKRKRKTSGRRKRKGFPLQERPTIRMIGFGLMKMIIHLNVSGLLVSGETEASSM